VDEIRAGEHVFDFEFHKGGNNHGYSYFAVNVKNHRWPDLPKKYEYKLERLDAIKHETREILERWAWDDTQEQWWDWATDYAQQLHLGKVYSTGRSSGWLILHEYTLDAVRYLGDSYESSCKHCDNGWTEHAKGQCLFLPTRFLSCEESSLESLKTLQLFAKNIRESADYAPKDYLVNLRSRIDDAWADYQAAKKGKSDGVRSANSATT